MDVEKQNSKLPPCPQSPNCVCTESSDRRHVIEPIPYTTSTPDAINTIVNILSSEKAKIVSKNEQYIRAEYRSKLFRFVDDVEFYFDNKTKVIHFRSASRIGYSDMGVNRKRMERIRGLFYR